MSGTLGVFVKQGSIVTGLGLSTPSVQPVLQMSVAERAEYIQSQHEAVQAAQPGRPWFDPTATAQAGFEEVLWPPNNAALWQLLHDTTANVVKAATGYGNAPWRFRVPPCETVRAMLGATAVFEDTVDGGKRRLAVVGLPFPDMDKAGAALLKKAYQTGGLVQLAPTARTVAGMPPGHRRRSSEDSGEPKLWIGPSGVARVKRPYTAAWISPQGIVWPDAEAFWAMAWPAAVAAKVTEVKAKWAPPAATDGIAPPADRRALIEELQLPQPTPLDIHGRAISADRARERLVEWNRYLRSNRFKEQYMPRCPAWGWPASVNAVVRFCPPNECDRCPRRPRDSVADVLASGHRAPCLVKAIERGGNESRYQAAAIIAVAAARRAKGLSPSPESTDAACALSSS